MDPLLQKPHPRLGAFAAVASSMAHVTSQCQVSGSGCCCSCTPVGLEGERVLCCRGSTSPAVALSPATQTGATCRGSTRPPLLEKSHLQQLQPTKWVFHEGFPPTEPRIPTSSHHQGATELARLYWLSSFIFFYVKSHKQTNKKKED